MVSYYCTFLAYLGPEVAHNCGSIPSKLNASCQDVKQLRYSHTCFTPLGSKTVLSRGTTPNMFHQPKIIKLRLILAPKGGKEDTKEIELHSKDFARANHGISSMSCLDGASSNA